MWKRQLTRRSHKENTAKDFLPISAHPVRVFDNWFNCEVLWQTQNFVEFLVARLRISKEWKFCQFFKEKPKSHMVFCRQPIAMADVEAMQAPNNRRRVIWWSTSKLFDETRPKLRQIRFPETRPETSKRKNSLEIDSRRSNTFELLRTELSCLLRGNNQADKWIKWKCFRKCRNQRRFRR